MDKPKTKEMEIIDTSKNIQYPPGCGPENDASNSEIVEFGDVGTFRSGSIRDVKSVQTKAMKKANNLITFEQDGEGMVRFWSCGQLNNFLQQQGVSIIGRPITIQRIEDMEYSKGSGRQYRVFFHEAE